MNEDRMRELVKDADLDWQRGYMLGEDETNRFRVLILAAVAAERERCAQIVRESWEVHGCCCSDRDALADVIAGGA